jgi:hypothetical protein
MQVSKLYPDLYQPVPAPLAVAVALGGHPAWISQGLAQAREEERYASGAEDPQVRRAAQQRLSALEAKIKR